MHWIDGIENLRCANERDTLRAVFSSLIVKFSNKISETSEFTKPPTFPKGAVGKWMERKTQELLKNQLELAKKISKTSPVKIWNDNILTLKGPEEKTIDCTITSPPFPGTYDYFELHELRMKWLDFPTEQMTSGEITNRSYTPKQWKQVFREFMLKLRRWTTEEGVCYLHLGDWLESGERVSGLEFTKKYPLDMEGLTKNSIIIAHDQEKVIEYGVTPFFSLYQGELSNDSVNLLEQIINEGNEVFIFKTPTTNDEKETLQNLIDNYGFVLKDYSKTFCKVDFSQNNEKTDVDCMK